MQGTHTIFKTHQRVLQECFSLVSSFFTGIAKNTNGIQNTPEGDVRMYHIVLLFLYWAGKCKKHKKHTHDNQNSITAFIQHCCYSIKIHTRGCCKMYDNNQVFNVLSLLQESHRTHLLIKNTPEGVVKFLQWYCVFAGQRKEHTVFSKHLRGG